MEPKQFGFGFGSVPNILFSDGSHKKCNQSLLIYPMAGVRKIRVQEKVRVVIIIDMILVCGLFQFSE